MVEGLHSILTLFKTMGAKQSKIVLLTIIMMLTSGQEDVVVAQAKTVIKRLEMITVNK